MLAGGVVGIAGIAEACAAQDSEPAPASPAPSVSPSGSVARRRRRRRAADWKHLARHVDGTLARPGSTTYNTVRLTQNPRYDGARPLAVLSVASAHDVARAIAFARDHGVPVAIRSGGHSYPGWSAGDGALVVDVRPLDGVSLNGTTATIGAGASLVQVYDGLGTRGRGIPGGSCATVGIAGLTQGGGVGVLTRAYGLTCDSVTAMQVVLADGTVVTASADEEPDLFWALRGGGGGHLGVVTSFTFRTFAAPTITRAYVAWPFSAADQVVPSWLRTIPQLDPRLWATLKLLGGKTHPSGPALFMSATWTGPASAMDGVLKPFLSTVPRPDHRLPQHRELPRHDADLRRVFVDPGRPVPHRAGWVARPRGVRRHLPHHQLARRRHEQRCSTTSKRPRAAGSRRPASRSTPWAGR